MGCEAMLNFLHVLKTIKFCEEQAPRKGGQLEETSVKVCGLFSVLGVAGFCLLLPGAIQSVNKILQCVSLDVLVIGCDCG